MAYSYKEGAFYILYLSYVDTLSLIFIFSDFIYRAELRMWKEESSLLKELDRMIQADFSSHLSNNWPYVFFSSFCQYTFMIFNSWPKSIEICFLSNFEIRFNMVYQESFYYGMEEDYKQQVIVIRILNTYTNVLYIYMYTNIE